MLNEGDTVYLVGKKKGIDFFVKQIGDSSLNINTLPYQVEKITQYFVFNKQKKISGTVWIAE